jgi:diacylglycerol kinase (ATP)
MVSDPVQVILNPASSSGGGGRLLPQVEARLRARHIDFRLDRTEGPGHAVELAAAAVKEGVSRLLVVGGDGTVHEVVNGLLGAGPGYALPDMAVLPLGTGNDFYRMVGAPKTLDGAMDMLQWGIPRPFDVGQARWDGGSRWFVNLLGVGIDVEVLRRRERVRRLSGLAQYLVALLQAVAGFRPVPIRIRLEDGEVIEEPTTLAGITVGPSAGGGFLLNPGATPDDGLLDLCFVKALTLPQVLRYIPRVIRGTHGNLPVVRLRRFREAVLEAPGPEPFDFELDGERMAEPVHRVDVRVDPARIRVLIPGRGEE